jgi:predicted neutral ceramidase superfamily lipid hydrolase
MNFIKAFYRKTIYFWIVTEVFFIVPCIIAIADLPFKKNIPAIVINSFFVLYTLSIIVAVVLRLIKRKSPFWMNIFTGTLTIILSIGLFYLLIFESKQVYVVFAFCVVFWMLFYGVWKVTDKATATNSRHA